MSKTLNLTYENPRPDDHYGELVDVKPGKAILPTRYKRFANAIYNFEYRKGDILLSSFPKSGTTWTAAIIWAMTHINEIPRAYEESVNLRTFIIDNDFLHDLEVDVDKQMLKAKDPNAKASNGITIQLANLEKGPRLIWSHLPYNLQNPQAFEKTKVVYVIRHPKDNLYSRYNHFAKHFDFTLERDLPPMAEKFMAGDISYGSYWAHINEAWKRRDHPNMHVMFYEDMKKDIMGQLKNLNEFLELGLSDQQLQKVIDHTSFENMKKYPTMSPLIQGFKGSFLFKGVVGASKGKLPPEMDARMDAWTKENSLKVDPNFKYAQG